MDEGIINPNKVDPIMERLDDQIAWYDRKSLLNQRSFKLIKTAEICLAALIPLVAAFNFTFALRVTGVFGAAIAVLEGLLQLNQYQQNWTAYRSTCESLKHEKYVYLGRASPYVSVPDPHALLAERIESLVSQEHAKWASAQQRECKSEKG